MNKKSSIKEQIKRKLSDYNFLVFWGMGILACALVVKTALDLANINLLILIGAVVLSVGIGFRITTYDFEKVEDETLEKALDKIKSERIKNVIKNLHRWNRLYRSKDQYICRFHKKTGGLLTIFENSEEKAQEYLKWYLNTEDNSKPLTVNLSDSMIIRTKKEDEIIEEKTITRENIRGIRIAQSDIEEYEYKRISWTERNVINPVIAFIKQPTRLWISLKSMTVLTLIIFLIGGFIGHIKGSIYFTGEGSLKTLFEILRITQGLISNFILILVMFTIIYAISSYGKAIKNFYSNGQDNKYTVGKQLLNCILFPLAFNFIIVGAMPMLLELVQKQGYLLP